MSQNVTDGSNGTIDSIRYLLRTPDNVKFSLLRPLSRAF